MFNIFKIFKDKDSYSENTDIFKSSTFKEPFYRETSLVEEQPDINNTRSHTSTVAEKGGVYHNKQLSEEVSNKNKLYNAPMPIPNKGIRCKTKISDKSVNSYRCYIGSSLQCRTTINSMWIYTAHNEFLHRIDNYKNVVGNYDYSNAECRIVELNEQEIEFLFHIKGKGPTSIVSKNINNGTKVSANQGKSNKDKVLQQEKQQVSSISKIRVDLVNRQHSTKTVANTFSSDIAKIRRYDNSEDINIQSSSGFNYNVYGDYEIDGGYDEYGYDEDMNGAYD